MPSKTPKQAKFMRAIAHGWTPSRMKSPPSRAVAQEFVEADRKYSGGFAENRYWTGGLAAMDEVNSGIDETLNWLEGGPVNYYQEGGDVRPGHAEGRNIYEGKGMPASYKQWERKHHIDPPVEAPEVEPEKPSWWQTLVRYAKGPQHSEEGLRKLEAETGEAHGGRVGYQLGGLAMAAPAGGVPPWIQPTGAGPGGMLPPGYAEEPQGYQFGGMASQFRGMRNRMPYRGVPPQRGGIQRGAPPGGGRGFLNRFRQQRGQQLGGGPPQGGGLAAMMRQAQQQRGQMPRGGVMGGQYDPGGSRSLPPGGIPNDFPGGEEILNLPPPDPNATVYDRDWDPRSRGPMAPGGGPLQIPGGGNLPPYKQLPRQRRQVPPSPPGGPGSVIGGPRVPPNLQGYLQRQRIQNRPPSGPVGGGGNRVGMQDQQGALSRALQRGTGRPPMSRRFGQGRAGPTR